jgi:hypothetical protein
MSTAHQVTQAEANTSISISVNVIKINLFTVILRIICLLIILIVCSQFATSVLVFLF